MTTPPTSRFVLIANNTTLDIVTPGLSHDQELEACDAMVVLFRLGLVQTYEFYSAHWGSATPPCKVGDDAPASS